MTHPKLTFNREAFRIVAIAITAMCFLATITAVLWIGHGIYRLKEYHSYPNRIRAVIDLMDLRRPHDVGSEVWEFACSSLMAANGNIYASPDYAPVESARQLCDKFESQATASPDLNTVEWMWDEFAAGSPHGAWYAKRNRGRYLEFVEARHPELLTDEMREHLREWREIPRSLND